MAMPKPAAQASAKISSQPPKRPHHSRRGSGKTSHQADLKGDHEQKHADDQGRSEAHDMPNVRAKTPQDFIRDDPEQKASHRTRNGGKSDARPSRASSNPRVGWRAPVCRFP